MSVARKSRLSPSQEDYLEAILALISQVGAARVRDIANRLAVGKPAVTAALKLLSRHKLVNYDPYQLITLTEQGRQAAQTVTNRHEILNRFLQEILGLDKKAADANACRIEHTVDDVLLSRLDSLMNFIEDQPFDKSKNWLKRFREYCMDAERNSKK